MQGMAWTVLLLCVQHALLRVCVYQTEGLFVECIL